MLNNLMDSVVKILLNYFFYPDFSNKYVLKEFKA